MAKYRPLVRARTGKRAANNSDIGDWPLGRSIQSSQIFSPRRIFTARCLEDNEATEEEDLMYFSPGLTHCIRTTAFAIAVAALALVITEWTYAPSQATGIALTTGSASAPPPGKVQVTAESVQQCPSLQAPASMSGVTELNTVKSQMWIVNGIWWGAFSNSGLYFYKRVGNSFVKGALIDSGGGRPDTIWNGTNLFILIYKSSSQATLRKYRYDAAAQTYTQLLGFPINISLSSASSITFAQDSQGKLWAAYTGSGLAKAIWSTSADHTIWNAAGHVLASGLSSSGEIAAIVAFGGNRIGVSWSNQAVGEDGFRYHEDGTTEINWSAKE
ncbi:MAG TPA: hypothetical protein VJ180_05750, partial [Pyrinomonadaceae bacterium]|nr:hypothetical protein [Pyrinomonadaceae bacterium]